MGTASSPGGPAAEWRWTRLLDYIQAGLVVPIVGRELLRTSIDGATQYVPAYLARQLCERAGLSWTAELETLSDPIGKVVERLLESPRGRNWPYTALFQLTTDLQDRTEPPEAFAKLAEIPFRLFVSTTSDSYLERAVNAARFGGAPRTVVPPYALGSTADLVERGHAGPVTVFPLLGVANPSPDYAVTDEDVLEFVYQFQAKGTPRGLLDALRQSHLLLIGSGFSDWLTRFLVRLAKPERLWASTTGQLTHFVADAAASGDPDLRAFLQHPLSDTEMFAVDTAAEFVDELHRRWKLRHPVAEPERPSAIRGAAAPSTASPPPALEPAAGGVFLSYAREDYDAACRVRDALDAAGIDVWFDKRGLETGHDYEQRIARQIARSHAFIVVISRTSLTDEPRFFRFEWREAEERSKFVAFDLPYIMPVCIDDTSMDEDRLPQFIRKVHWTRAPGGDVPAAFVRTVVAAYRQFQRRRA